MEEEKKEFIAWVKAHKKELIIAGIGIGTLITVIFGIQNRDSLLRMWNAMKAVLNTNWSSAPIITVKGQDIMPAIEAEILPSVQVADAKKIIQAPFCVSGHVRNLHPGWNASAEKLAEAKALGIILLPGQTLVDAYTKGGTAA